MPDMYTIKIQNKKADTTFAVFQARPDVTKPQTSGNDGVSPGNGDIWSSVWDSKRCASDDSITIQAALEFYGWSGTINQPAQIGAKVVGGNALPAKVGQGATPGNTFFTSHAQGNVIIQAAAKDTAESGAFQVDTGKFDASAHVLIGMAKPDPDSPGTYLPTAVINATGQTAYQIFPKNDYFVYASETETGKIFDYQAWSAKAGKIKFSDHPSCFTAKVTYTSDGNWNIVYDS
ncbi:MAG: hypothetical protein M1822_006894 [Bathelium mastoideum]|nr:MAG: hypothetical protein M1822_006894 [Bathelium mastoideum]